jgi:hypothetical protein
MRTNGTRFVIGVLTTALLILSGGVIMAHASELQRFAQSAVKITMPGGRVIPVDPFITKNPKTSQEFKQPKMLWTA